MTKFSLVLFAFFLALGAISAFPVSACGALNTANAIYTLTADIWQNTSSYCISFGNVNITFDGQGHTIYTNGSGIYGIEAGYQPSAKVFNTNFTGAWTGAAIHLNSEGMTVRNVSVNESGGLYGILAEGGYNNGLIDNASVTGAAHTAYRFAWGEKNWTISNSFSGGTPSYGFLAFYGAIGTKFINDTCTGADYCFAAWETSPNCTFINVSAYNKYPFDGDVNSGNLTVINSTFNASGTDYAFHWTGTGATILGNKFQGSKWISNTGTANFNDSNSGNIYYFANGSGAWTVFNISVSNPPGYAQSGTARPFNATTVGGNWSGSGQDWFPWTANNNATNTCTYSSGNWLINCADLCNITTNVNIGANNLIFNGTSGYARFGNSSLNPQVITALKYVWNVTGAGYIWTNGQTWFNGTMGG